MQSESWIEHGLRHKQNLWHWACLSTTLNQSGPFQQRCCFLTCASVSEYLWVCAQQWLRRCYNPQNPHSRSSWSLCLGHQCSLNAQLPGLVTRKGEDTPQAQRLLSSHSNGAVLWGYCYMLKAGGQILVFVDCLCINIKRNGTWQDRWIVNLCVCVWYPGTLYSGCLAVSVVEVDVALLCAESLESCSMSSSMGPSGTLETYRHTHNFKP